MPDGLVIPGGPGFSGHPQPPDVPCDPTGDAWRGEPGPPGPPGPAGPPGSFGGGEAPVDGFAYGRVNAVWNKVVPLTQLGTAVGQVPVFANYQSTGFASLAFPTRFIVTKSGATTPTDFTTMQVFRTTTHTGGAAGNVATALRVGTTIGNGVTNQEWALLSTVVSNSTTPGGAAVGGDFQAQRNAGSPTPIWGGIFNAIDLSGTSSSATLGAVLAGEIDVRTTGADDGLNGNMVGGMGLRAGLQFVLVRNLTTVDVEASHGIWFSCNEPANAKWSSAMGFAVGTQTYQALDTRGAIPPTGYANPVAAVRMLAGQAVDFNGGPALNSAPGNYLQYTTTGTPRLRYMVGANERWSVSDSGALSASVVATGGTAARSLQDRFGQVIDIRDLGAACDGVTDDTAAWTAAFAKPSGTVIRIPQNCVTVVRNMQFATTASVSIIGDGPSSIIRLQATETITNGLFTWSGAATNVRIENLTLDLNNCVTPSALAYGINLQNTHGCRVRGVSIINACVQLYMVAIWGCNDFVVENCYFQATTPSSSLQSKGVTTMSALGTSLRGRVVNNTLINTNTSFRGASQLYCAGNDISGWGIGSGINTDPVATQVTVIGNKCHDSMVPFDMYGFTPAGLEMWATNSVVVGNECWNCSGAGIIVGGTNCLVVGNTCWDNNTHLSAIGGGIWLSHADPYTASGSVIMANYCYDSGVGRQSYGLNVGNAGIVNITLNANQFSGSLGDIRPADATFLPNKEYTPRLLAADPVAALGAATKQYVDAKTVGGRRLLYQSTTQVGNGADTTVDILQTYTVPANTLVNVGDRILLRAGGNFTGSTDNKIVTAQYGAGGNIITLTVNANPQQVWRLEMEVMKTGPNAQTFSGLSVTNSNVTTVGMTTGLRADNIANVISVSGQNTTAATASSITCRYFTVDYVAAA